MKDLSRCACVLVLGALVCSAQETPAAKPAEHVLGTITNVDPSAHSIRVKDDKTGSETVVLLENTKTLLKVPPGAKDLKSATRISSDDLQPNDRVDVRGAKSGENPNAMAARSVLLMSARELAVHHQAEAAAWQHSTAATVNSVDAAGQKLDIVVRTPDGPKAMSVTISPSTEFSRYSPENPKTPEPSQLSDIQPADQVRIIGEQSDDGSSIAAQKIYSGAFRTIAGTVTAISADGKQLTITDLQTKRPVLVSLTEESTVRKLPPMMAAGLARHLNPSAASAQQPSDSGNSAHPNPDAAARPMRSGSGDLSRMLEHVPTSAVSDLKSGDAVIVSGAMAGADKGRLVASNIIAGVEPIFQSAPPRQGRSLGDWSLDMEAPAQ
jgi:hypothetical protein